MRIRSLILFALFCLGVSSTQQVEAQNTLLPSGEQCFAALSPTSGGSQNTGTGMIGLLGSITGGTGGTAGTYGGVTLTGSLSGQSNATANITVSGGAVTAVAILNPGSQYVVGDVLTATPSTIGNVSGFSVPVSSIAINTSLAGGTVGYYIPNTNTFKQTYQNSAGTILNTNPVTLDANGCAIVYGSGIYRQVLKDSLGNTIWDQLTASTNQNNPFWAGQAGGTANAITVTDTSFSGTDGQIVNFIPAATNTGPTTFNPSAYFVTPPPIVKDTSSGAVGLVGGEIVASGTPNVLSVVYSATQSNFHILNNPVLTASNPPLCGASNLKIVNNGTTPSAVINLTADQITMQSSAGLTITRSSVSLTAINIALGNITSTANGMDGESPGSNAWLNVFAIDNGTTTAGLLSLAAGNAKNPALPSTYTYKCFLGVMRVDGSGNLYRILQLGQDSQWTPSNTTNNTVYPTLGITNVGIGGATPAGTIALASLVPPTATRVRGSIMANGAGSAACIGPNNSAGINWTNCNEAASGPPVSIQTVANVTTNVAFDFLIEGTSLYYNANAGGAGIVVGWRNSVNAN